MTTTGDRGRARVAVVVDSAASLPSGMAWRSLLHVVPMVLTVGGRTYLDGRDLAPTDFYRMLRESATPPSTSAPSPASFLEAFRQAATKADSVLCLTVASRFSASFASANTAAQEARRLLSGVEFTVMDTGSAAGGEGLIALEAWRTAMNGAEIGAVRDAAQNVLPRVRVLAFLDTLYYLWKSGRAPMVAHAGASLLQLKPLFEMKQGQIRTVARPRTRGKAMRRLLELMRERIESDRVHATVMHADAADAAEELRRGVEAEFPCEELFVSELTPVMGAHTGPGLLGVSFWSQ